jgi:hypothetical protein
LEQKDRETRSPKIAEKTSKLTPKRAASNSYRLLGDLNLHPKDAISFKNFTTEKKPLTNFERNAVIVYYLQKIIKVSPITPDHVYTCYKSMGVPVPLVVQSLYDTKNRKGWVDTADLSNLSLTLQGENFIEHEITARADDKE